MSNYYFDHVISLTLLSGSNQAVPVTIPTQPLFTPSSQYKPGIEFNMSYIPGMLCHACTVKVTNLSPTIDIKLYDRMIITAGYRYYDNVAAEEYELPIFTKYRTSPNPDGVTVIQGLLLGKVKDLFSPDSYSIKNVPEEMKVKDFINVYLLGASGVEVENGVPKSLGSSVFYVINRLPSSINESMIAPGKSSGFTTKWEIVTHVEQTLAACVSSEKMGNKHLIFTVYNGNIEIGLQEGEATEPLVSEKTIKLNYVTTIEFNGAMLDITCPYVPGLVPGRLIKVNPKYYAGPDIPEVLTPQSFEVDVRPTLSAIEKKKGFQLFRILTMKLSFSTEEENSMTMSCLPWSLLPEDPGVQASSSVEYENLVKDVKETSLITYAKPSSTEWHGVLQYALKGSYIGKESKCKLGDTYIKGIRSIYKNKTLYLLLKDFDGKSVGSIDKDGNLVFQQGRNIFVSTDYLWVLAMKMTYDKAQQRPDMYYTDPNHPLSLHPFKYAIFPEIQGDVESIIAAIAPDKELFKLTADVLKGQNKYTEAIVLYNMYILLGGAL